MPRRSCRSALRRPPRHGGNFTWPGRADGHRFLALAAGFACAGRRWTRALFFGSICTCPAVDPDGRQPGDVMGVSNLPALNATLTAWPPCFSCSYGLHQAAANRGPTRPPCWRRPPLRSSDVLLAYHAKPARSRFGTGRAAPCISSFRHSYRAAAAIVPMVLMTLSPGPKQRFDRHAVIASERSALALCVGNGCVIYLMLYRFYRDRRPIERARSIAGIVRLSAVAARSD